MARKDAAEKAAQKKASKALRNKKKVAADATAKTTRAVKGTKAVKAAPQPEEDTRKLPGKKSIQQLSKDFMAASDRASTLAGKAGELISDAVKKIHLNAREFKRAHSLKSMGLRDPAKLRLALSDFDYYRSCLELDKLAGEGLFEAGEGRPEIEEESETDTETESPPVATENGSDTEREAAFH